MKVKQFMLGLFLMGIASCSAAEENKHAGAEKVITDKIRFCESTYPLGNAILIANFGTEELNPLNTEGKGYILSYQDGQTRMFIPADGNLSAPKGMLEKDGYLYICDVNKIVVYNLKQSAVSPQIISFPENALFVNDLVVDGTTLYASVTNNDWIYTLDISRPAALTDVKPVEWCKVSGPNGLLLVDNVMYVASYPADGTTKPENVIYSIGNLKKPVPTKVIDQSGQYDGIAMSGDKRTLYVTNWNPAGIFAIDMATRKITPFSINTSLTGAADITLKDGILYIPDLPNSRMIEASCR